MADLKMMLDIVDNGKLPKISIKDMDKIFSTVSQAGAEIILRHLRAHAPHPSLVGQARKTDPYLTRYDDAFNIKDYYGGYLSFRGNRTTFSRYNRKGGAKYVTTLGVPANFLSILFYKGSRAGSSFPKRASFIENIPRQAVNKVMEKYFNSEMKKIEGIQLNG